MVCPGYVTREHLSFLRAQAREAAADAAVSSPVPRRAAAQAHSRLLLTVRGRAIRGGREGAWLAGLCDRGTDAVTSRLWMLRGGSTGRLAGLVSSPGLLGL